MNRFIKEVDTALNYKLPQSRFVSRNIYHWMDRYTICILSIEIQHGKWVKYLNENYANFQLQGHTN